MPVSPETDDQDSDQYLTLQKVLLFVLINRLCLTDSYTSRSTACF